MKITIKHIISTIGFVCFLFLAVGSTEDSGSSGSSSGSSSKSSSSSSRESTQKYHNVSGGSSSSISTCRTCGLSYTVASLPYGDYCSQGCCAAYEGVSSKCGY